MRIRVLGLASCLSFTLAAFAAPASAQQATGFALDRFEPSERGSDWFALESLDLRGNGRPAIGVVGDYAHKPLVVYGPDGNEIRDVVSEQFVLHAGGSLVLWDRLRLAFNLPFVAYQTGDGGAAGGSLLPTPGSPAVGDLRIGADVRLFGVYGDPITMALGVQGFAPTGSQNDFTSDGTFRVLPRLLAAGKVGVFVYSAKVAFDYRAHDATFVSTQLGSDVLFGAAAGVQVLDDRLVVGPEIYGSTIVTSDQGAFQKKNTPFEAIVGMHYQVDDWKVGAGVGPGLSRGYGAPEFRALASIEWAPGIEKDRDHDGVLDADDACPDTAGLHTNDPKTNGCPDRDGDGVFDVVDACPSVPGIRTSDPKTNGCPDKDHDAIPDAVDACPETAGVPSPDPKKNGCPADRDSDGIIDSQDACPDVAGIKTSDPQTNGCPDKDKDGIPDKVDACVEVPGVASPDPKKNGCPPDRDNDGVIDTEDACPDQPGIRTNDPKTNGCPDPDRDKDNIVNDQDACPDVAGPPNKDPKKNGCPQAYVQQGQIKITDQVKFRTASAELDPAGDSILNAVLKILTDHPEIKKVKIEGHTDNVGPAGYNQVLSEARAKSVLEWLVKHGVDRSRLESQGFGLTRPIADNATEEGRRQNRRVEFHILDDGSTQAQP